ncbi:cupin domain-containing protein, partial [Serratia bockelmannii]
MTEKAELLAQRLIRNVEQVEMKHDRRPPLYDSIGARLGTGTAADKLGASFDCVAPGMRSCPYHFHYAQEEMFIILEG